MIKHITGILSDTQSARIIFNLHNGQTLKWTNRGYMIKVISYQRCCEGGPQQDQRWLQWSRSSSYGSRRQQLRLLVWSGRHHCWLFSAVNTSAVNGYKNGSLIVAVLALGIITSYPAEAMVRGQHVGGPGGFHGCGGGGRRRWDQAWLGPLLKAWLGQPHLGGARFHHGFTSES